PGNAGTLSVAENIPINPEDPVQVANVALEKKIDLILIGPEAPLVAGVADYLTRQQATASVKVVGPTQKGAMLEASKDFSKAFMNKYHIPTAFAKTFTASQLSEAIAFLSTQQPPFVLKADGLAAGKGVIICHHLEEAIRHLTEMLQGKFGKASQKVLIEQFLNGIELSVFILTDGRDYVLLPTAKDYKRVGENDTGLNTGGMGAVSPVPFADEVFMKKVEERIIRPTLSGLRKEDIEYIGFIFFGLMNVNGEPYVIEYNARMGDPETEVVIPRIQTDFLELLCATAEKRLSQQRIDIDERAATTVMLVSGGYPETYEKGKKISGLDTLTDVIVFHAGTTIDKENNLVTNGGRVMALTAFGKNIEEALKKSNHAALQVHFDKKYYRKDIGLDLL
ncbi:MAG: phosphoribosylamine--glycine ligase, partial [Flammeovirgaceae bacterium]|nr:phosphoribosylamine--glycine ligase [Flammeovirgaceae bacterium]MDW8286918.1 phosphoribosylamine--glycine ligase [Flammeovirgaceae bacterium]